MHAFYHNTSDKYPEQLNYVIEALIPYFDTTVEKNVDSLYKEFEAKADKRSEVEKLYFSKLKEMMLPEIDEYFKNNGLKSQDKKKDILDILLQPDETKEKRINDYLRRFSKDGGIGYKAIFEKYEADISEARDLVGRAIQEVRNAVNKHFELKYKREHMKYMLIFPNNKYGICPLGDRFIRYEFPPSANMKNCIQLNIEFTCERANYNYDIYPREMYLQYRLFNDGVVTEKFYFIEIDNEFTNISTNMEYKTGINELTLSRYKPIHFAKVFKDIVGLVDDNTEMMIYSRTSGWKSKVRDILSYPVLENTLLQKKLRKLVKR